MQSRQNLPSARVGSTSHIRRTSKGHTPLLHRSKVLIRNLQGLAMTSSRRDYEQCPQLGSLRQIVALPSSYPSVRLVYSPKPCWPIQWMPPQTAQTRLSMISVRLATFSGPSTSLSKLSSHGAATSSGKKPHPRFFDVRPLISNPCQRS